jgi:hypothetical protein
MNAGPALSLPMLVPLTHLWLPVASGPDQSEITRDLRLLTLWLYPLLSIGQEPNQQ